MKNYSRRDFLRMMGLSISAIAAPGLLASCEKGVAATEELIATPTQFQPEPTLKSRENPYLVVAHGEKPETLVRRGIKALGGIERFVKPGANVIIKPNISVPYYTYEYGATTNPWVVGAIVKLCVEAGAKRVRVMDSPYGGTAEDCYLASGIEEQVKLNGGEMEVMLPLKYQTYDIPGGELLKSVAIYPDFFEADLFINVPIAKQHGLSVLSMGLKNMMGTIQKREKMHNTIDTKLVDLSTVIKPDLTIIDAIRTIMKNGPAGGNLEDIKIQNTMVFSEDVFTADSYCAKLFKKKPQHLPYLVQAAERGLGIIDYESVKMDEFTINA